MAEETKNINVENTTSETENTPTVEELMAQLAEKEEQLAQSNADRDKYKSANDRLSKSEAEMKRQLRAKQSAEEQEASAKAEEERLKAERIEFLESQLNHNNAVMAYKSVSDEKMVDSLIDAVSNADHKAIAEIMEKFANAKVKEAQAEWQKSRPRVNMGGDGTVTKEQFNAMSTAEKSKLYRENKAEYDRLNN